MPGEELREDAMNFAVKRATYAGNGTVFRIASPVVFTSLEFEPNGGVDITNGA